MISSLSSLFWGEPSVDSDFENPANKIEEISPDEDDWVIVGTGYKPSRSFDNALYTLPPGDPAFTMLSNPPSSMPYRAEIVLMMRRLKCEENCSNSALLVRHQVGGAGLSREALKRANMNVMSSGRSRKIGRQTFQMKMAGQCRNLKQC